MSASFVLLEEVIATTKILGDSKTIKILQNARKKKVVIDDSCPIIDVVLSSFNIQYEDLHNIKDAEQKKVIITLLVYFLRTEAKLKPTEINLAIGTNYTSQRLSQYYSIVKKCNFNKPKSPLDQKITQYHSIISKKITHATN